MGTAMSFAIVGETPEHGEHCPLILHADAFGEIRVLAEQGPHGYELTNRYADGIVGVTELDEQEAEVDDQPACMCCGDLVTRWDHDTTEET